MGNSENCPSKKYSVCHLVKNKWHTLFITWKTIKKGCGHVMKPKNMTYEALCFALATTEFQIAASIQQKKEIIEEIKRRKPFLMDKYNRGELQMETNEFMEGEEIDE